MTEEIDDKAVDIEDLTSENEESQEKNNINENIADTPMCTICREDTECDFITRCGHKFHKKCLIKNDSESCPNCRYDVTCSTFIENYLLNMRYLDRNARKEIDETLKKTFGVNILSDEILKELKIGPLASRNLDKLLTSSCDAIQFGHALLRWICRSDDLCRLNILMKNGLRLENNLKATKSALKLAKKKGSRFVINRIEGYLWIARTGKYGDTILHTAIKKKETTGLTIKLMFVSGMNELDAEARNKKGERPLHLAAARANLDVVRYLIQHGAKVNCHDIYGRTPLERAMKSKNSQRAEIIELLIKAGAKIDYTDNEMNTLLHKFLISQNFDIAEILIDYFPNMNELNAHNESYILLAASYGPKSLLEKMIKKGADVNLRDSNRDTPLHKAVKTNDVEVVELLLKSGANVNVMNAKWESPIHFAFNRSSSVEIVKALGSNGPVFTLNDSNGIKAVVMALESHK